MNVIDLCPVGALTSRNSGSHPACGICGGPIRSARVVHGGAIYASAYRNNAILRIDPRTNMEVNKWWICDFGRLQSWQNVHSDTRISAPYVRELGNIQQVSWNDAFSHAGAISKKYKPNEIAFVASPFTTNEDNFLLRHLARDVANTPSITLTMHVAGTDDGLLIRANRCHPNRSGAHITSGANLAPDALMTQIERKNIKLLLVLDEDILSWQSEFPVKELLKSVENIIVLASNENGSTAMAKIVFPAASFAEIEGTITNFAGYTQLLAPAIATLENEGRMGMQKSRLDRSGTEFDRWAVSGKHDARPHWKILQGIANAAGAHWQYTCAADIFDEIARKIPEFRALSYERLEELNGAFVTPHASSEKAIAWDRHCTMKYWFIVVSVTLAGVNLYAQITPLPFRTTGNDYAPAITADGQRMYFSTLHIDSAGNARHEEYYADKTESGWSAPYNCGMPINDTLLQGWACISPDGTTMVLTIWNAPDRLQVIAIYISQNCRTTDRGVNRSIWGRL